MEISFTKNRLLCFITPFVVCVLLGYFLFHNLMQGILYGIGSGMGTCMAKRHEKRREKTKQEETEKNTKTNTDKINKDTETIKWKQNRIKRINANRRLV
jgi:hypothetical protein